MLKTCPPNFINKEQTGFISGRFISENIRLVYDSIENCNAADTKGLLMILDFSKSFDTIEWPFIIQV